MNAILLIAAIYGTLDITPASTNLVRAPYASCTGCEYVTNVTERIDHGVTNIITTVTTNYVWTETASLDEPTANRLGWKLVEDVRPATFSNEYAVAVGWAETNRIYRLYEIHWTIPPPRKFSKLKIYGTLASLDQVRGTANGATWDLVKAWLEAKDIGGVNGWMAFQLAQEVSEDHPMFAPLAAEAKALLGLTDAQFEAFLNACILDEN